MGKQEPERVTARLNWTRRPRIGQATAGGPGPEREDLVIAEWVLNRLAEQYRAEAEAAATVAPAPVRVAGRTVLLIPHRSKNPRRGRAAR
ncbi:hypothetical protein [Streptomyces humidus]|uniref:hypothetical protein n=1 Tax=Streptomyces humidus TaxID=52259 RepID=UPI00331CE679